MGFLANGAQPTLSAMLSFAAWQGDATRADVDALADALDVIRTACVQPVGTARGSGVTEAEFDAAVMRALAAAMVLHLSGALSRLFPEGGGDGR